MYAIRRCVNLKQLTKFEQISRAASIGQSSSLNDLKRKFYTYSPEPGQPIDREPTFCSIEDAVKCVKSGKITCVSYIYRFQLHSLFTFCMNNVCVRCQKLKNRPV